MFNEKISINISNILQHHIPGYGDQVRFLAGIGFEGIDFLFTREMVESHREGNEHGFYLQKMKSIAEENGITYGQAHSSAGSPFIDDMMDESIWQIEENLKACKYLNIPYLVVHPGMIPENGPDKFYELNTAFFKRVSKPAEESGVEVLIENIGSPGDPYFVRNGSELRKLVDMVGHPMVNACWDVGHANHHKQFCQYESITALGCKLKALHIHDNFGSYGLEDHCWKADLHLAPFFGNVNFDSVLQALVDIGYEGTLNFEVESPRIGFDKLPFEHKWKKVENLSIAPLDVVEMTIRMIYMTGRHMLEAYGDDIG